MKHNDISYKSAGKFEESRDVTKIILCSGKVFYDLLNKKNILSSALLSPQGKILFEMIIYSHGGNILIESNENLHQELIEKTQFI